MRLVRIFKTKKDVNSVNGLLDELQTVNDDNRIMNVQIDGSYAYITASVELDIINNDFPQVGM